MSRAYTRALRAGWAVLIAVAITVLPPRAAQMAHAFAAHTAAIAVTATGPQP
ncbi:MAG: hypothetical protein ACOH1V_02415 [Stenotrophomonas sp.]